MSALQRCIAVLLLLLSAPVHADEGHPSPYDLGRFLGYSIDCGCVQGDPDWLLNVYYAMFAEAYGESYADSMYGAVQLAMRKSYDNQTSICSRVCSSPATEELKTLVAGVDSMLASPEFRKYLDVTPEALAEGGHADEQTSEAYQALPSVCQWHEFNSRCDAQGDD